MASFRLLAVLLAAAVLPLNAHEQFFTADLKNGSNTVGSVAILTWHEGTMGWLNYTISLLPLAVGRLNVSKVSINDEGPDGEVVLDITKEVDLAGLAATGTASGTYEDLYTEIQHFTRQPGAHAFVIQTATGKLMGETYQLLTASPGTLAASLLNSQNVSVGNATVGLKTNTSTLSTVSLAIVLFPTMLNGTLKSVLVEENDGSIKYDWTNYINITTFNEYGEAKGSFLLNTTEADHLKEPGHYLSIKSDGGSARGAFSVPIAAAPAPAPSSAFPLASAIAMRFFSSTAAICTLLSLALY